ncbi:hypothetical protein CIB48_g5172 [Xylaria polymorpha]|nr:hypothetical protein CIB48_g5172 [Xylaria polymorpha]
MQASVLANALRPARHQPAYPKLHEERISEVRSDPATYADGACTDTCGPETPNRHPTAYLEPAAWGLASRLAKRSTVPDINSKGEANR